MAKVSILDESPFPWEDETAQELHTILISLYPLPKSAILVAQQSSLDAAQINEAQAPVLLWKDILELAARSRRTRRLVQLVFNRLNEKSVARLPLLKILNGQAGVRELFTDVDRVADGLQGRAASKRVATTDHGSAWRTLAVEPPPAWFIPRPEQHESVVRSLLDDANSPATTIGTALRGAGGFGKSMLARSVAADARIRRAYPDGVTWVTLGENPNIVSIVARLIRNLTGVYPAITGRDDAAAELEEVIAHRRLLLVVDDAWRSEDLEAFGEGATNWAGAKCRMLITTRVAACQPPGCVVVKVDEMSMEQACALLRWRLTKVTADANATHALGLLAEVLGCWPLLLALARDEIRNRLTDGAHLSLAGAADQVRHFLEDRGMVALDRYDESKREHAVATTLDLSLTRLSPLEFGRLVDLAAFPEDAAIPFAALDCVWHLEPHSKEVHDNPFDAVSPTTTLETLASLSSQSLIQTIDHEAETATLHDVIRDYLRRLKGGNSTDRARRILESLREGVPSDGHTLRSRARALIERIPNGPRGVIAPVRSNMRRLVTPRAIRWPKRAQQLKYLRLHVFWHLAAGGRHREAEDLNRDAAWQGVLHLEAACLSIAALADGRIVAGLKNGTLVVWDPERDTKFTLHEHTDAVRTLVVLPDGRVVSGSADGTLRVWSLETRRSTPLTGHSDGLTAVTVVGENQVVSASYDGTLRLWDLLERSSTILGRDRGYVTALSTVDSGLIVSGEGNSVRLWDLNTRKSREIGNHESRVTALCILPDGRVVSGGWDRDVCIWDEQTEEPHVYSGHSGNITAVAVVGRGRRIVSASFDNTLRMWDLRSHQSIELVGHTDRVSAVVIRRDGLLASGSYDKTVRLWDVLARKARK